MKIKTMRSVTKIREICPLLKFSKKKSPPIFNEVKCKIYVFALKKNLDKPK